MKLAALPFILLLLFSLLMLAWQHLGMQSELDALAIDNLVVNSIDDRANRGRSRAQLVSLDPITLNCRISSHYQWPYCQIQLKIGMLTLGHDLSRYSHVQLRLKVESEEGQDPGIRIYLNHFQDNFSVASDITSIKINEVEFLTTKDGSDLIIPLSVFQVASWWRAEKQVPLFESGPDFSNVADIYVSTGSLAKPGDYKITLYELKFVGKVLTRNQIYLGLLVLWVCFALLLLVLYLRQTQQLLQLSLRQQRQLSKANESLAIESHQHSRQARRDPLTGARNRLELAEVMEKLSQQQIEHCSFVFIDLDHFKALNDQLGHLFGDQVLKEFVSLIEANIRETDQLFRWGGEEFLLLCPYANLYQAAKVAQNLAEKVRQNPWPDGVAVRASFGLSQWLGQQSHQQALEQADQALYFAKEQGRDRVCVYDPIHEPPLRDLGA